MKKLVLLTCVALGSGPPQDPEALILQLRAEDIAVRERAFNDLEKLGAAAEASLKRVAADPDATVARQARSLLRILELERVLSPAMKRAFPCICRRLGLGPGEKSTKLYLDVAAARPDAQGKQPYASLTREDLEPLALDAVRNAVTPDDKSAACQVAAQWFHRSAQPAVMSLLRDSDETVRHVACRTLVAFIGRAALPAILESLQDAPALMVDAINAFDSRHAYEAQGCLIELLRHPDGEVVAAAVGALKELELTKLIPEVRGLLKSKSPAVKKAGLDFLDSFNAREAVGDVKELLDDSDPAVRAAAVQFLWEFDVAVPSAAVCRLFEEGEEDVLEYIVRKVPKSAGQDPAILELLRKRLHQNVPYTFLALKRLGDPQLEAISTGLLDHENEWLQMEAFNAMSATGSHRSMDLMRRILQDPARELRLRCLAFEKLASLKSLPPQDDLIRLLQGKEIPLALLVAGHLAATSPDLVRKEVPRILLDESSRNSRDGWELAALIEPGARVSLLLTALENAAESPLYVRLALREHKGDGYVPGLRALLEKGRPAAQAAAISLLADLEAVEARPDIVNQLGSSESEVRIAAIDAVSDFGLGPEVDVIRRLTTDSEAKVRGSALIALRHHALKEAIPDMVKLLDDAEWEVARTATEALVEMGSTEAVPKMVEWLPQVERARSNLAAEALAVLQPVAAEPGILSMLDHREAEVRLRGAWMLQMFGLKKHVRRLLPFFAEPRLVDDAVLAIVVLGAKELIPDLEALLSDPSSVCRSGSLDALTGFQSVASAPRIRKLLDDPDLDIRREAALTLGNFQDREAVPRLIEMLREPVRPLRVAASHALADIGDPKGAHALVRFLEDPAGDMFAPAVFALGKLRAAEAAPELLRCLREVPAYRALIIEALGNLGMKEAIPDLIKCIEEPGLADNAAGALAKSGAKDAIPAIRRRIEGRNMSEFFDLATALADLGDSSALVEALSSKEEHFRRNAAKELCARGDDRGVSVLLADLTFDEIPSELNAVRNPKLWRELKASPWNIRMRGSRRRILERIAAWAGVEVKWEGGKTFEELTWANEWESIGWGYPHSTVIDALNYATHVEYERHHLIESDQFSFILDRGLIRLLPHDEALKFWKQWWADDQAKKK